MKNKSEQLPDWFIFGEQGELDIEKTLNALPENPAADMYFFREVPEWFEVVSQDEIQKIINDIDKIPEKEKQRLSSEDISNMKNAFEKLRLCQSIALRKNLTAAQKEFMRCLCYWISLETMNAIPLSSEDEENLW